jgi:hypothetical protein
MYMGLEENMTGKTEGNETVNELKEGGIEVRELFLPVEREEGNDDRMYKKQEINV